MGKYNLIGHRFGQLVVVKELPANKHGEVVWLCNCDCGNTHIATSYNLLRGRTTKCKKCMFVQIAKANTTHGGKPKRLHEIYTNMKTRCHNPNYELWNRYGGRGISICREWEESFVAFRDWALNNGYSDDLQLDRIDNDGDYCPENCKWSDRVEQANNRRTNRILVLHGQKDTMANWARRTGLPYWLIQNRLDKHGWSEERTLTTPRVMRNGSNRRHAE